MLSQSMQEALNNQVKLEAASSHAYLAMASWSEIQPGLDNIAEYFFQQSEEERLHMLKLIRFINERGGFALIPALEQPIVTHKGLKIMFEEYLKHPLRMTRSLPSG